MKPPSLRFRLKTLMLFVLLAAGAFAMLAWLGDFGRNRWVARVQRQDYKLLLATETAGHIVAFFQGDDEQLVFFFERLEGDGSFSGQPTILDDKGNTLLALDASRPGIENLLPGEGTLRAWTDEIMRNRPQGYQYPIRRGYRGKLRFQFCWNYVDEKQDIRLDVTLPWRTVAAE